MIVENFSPNFLLFFFVLWKIVEVSDVYIFFSSIPENEAESAINIDSHKPLFNTEPDTYEEDELPSCSSAVTKPNRRISDTRSVVSNR